MVKHEKLMLNSTDVKGKDEINIEFILEAEGHSKDRNRLDKINKYREKIQTGCVMSPDFFYGLMEKKS